MSKKEEFAETWRRRYDQLSCVDQIKELSFFQDEYVPEKDDVSNFRTDTPVEFFRHMLSKKKNLRVLEFGGGLGHMANHILNHFDKDIEEWVNYEMQTHAITENKCLYPQYTGVISTKFLWDYPLRGDWDVFVSAHSIEHIKAYQAKKLFNKLRNHVEFIYLESPIVDDISNLSQDEINNIWSGCSACHVLEIGMKQLVDMLPEYNDIEQFRIPYILSSDPPFPSFSDRSFSAPDVPSSMKLFFYNGKKTVLSIPKGEQVVLEQGVIKHSSPRNTSAVRCLEKE